MITFRYDNQQTTVYGRITIISQSDRELIHYEVCSAYLKKEYSIKKSQKTNINCGAITLKLWKKILEKFFSWILVAYQWCDDNWEPIRKLLSPIAEKEELQVINVTFCIRFGYHTVLSCTYFKKDHLVYLLELLMRSFRKSLAIK